MEKLRDKNQIIQTYQKAQTIKELEEVKEESYKDYGKFLSWDLMQIKAVYNKKMEEFG